MNVRVQTEPFEMGELVTEFTEAAGGAGAIVTFSGIVRDNGGTLQRMVIEHYPGMTEKALASIRGEAMSRWSLDAAWIVHRVGALAPGAQIMMVATAARHRVAAFEAAEFLMDYLKSRAPFWKKEYTQAGAAWVEARSEDEAALDRWSAP